MTVPGHFLRNTKCPRTVMSWGGGALKNFLIKNLFPKKEKKNINHFNPRANARSGTRRGK